MSHGGAGGQGAAAGRPLAIGVVCYPSFGGSGVIASQLAAGLARRGHRVHIIASAPPSRALPDSDRLFLHEVSVPDDPLFDHPPYSLALASTIVDVVNDHRLDLLHVHYAVPHSASAYLARQVLGRTAPCIVTTLHGTDVTRFASDPCYRSVTRFTVAASDGLTVPSGFLKDEAYRLLGLAAERRIEIIPNFVDTHRFAPAEVRDPGRLESLFAAALGEAVGETGPFLFHVSNFRPVKRIADLLHVLARVRRHTAARLVLVGDGPERPRAAELARELDLAKSVCFLGKRADFADYLKHADAFLLPSDSESFGVAALEALSAGVPVFAYRVGGLPEVVTSDVGCLVDPYDVDALAQTVLSVVTDTGRRSALGRAARAHVVTRFREEPALDHYEAYFRAILSQRAAAEDRVER